MRDASVIAVFIVFLAWMVAATFSSRWRPLASLSTWIFFGVHLVIWSLYPAHDLRGEIEGWTQSPLWLGVSVPYIVFELGVILRAVANFIAGHRVPYENPLSMWLRFLSMQRVAAAHRRTYRFAFDALFVRVVLAAIPAMVLYALMRAMVMDWLNPEEHLGVIVVSGFVTNLVGSALSLLVIFQAPRDEADPPAGEDR